MMIRILIADDHDIVRAGIRRFLELENDMEIVGEAGTGRETLSLCGKLKPDVILLDLDMPDIDGLEAIPQLVALHPEVGILVLTMHDNEEYAIRAMKSGAMGFVLKGSSPGDLPRAVRAVNAGNKFIAAPVMEKIALRRCNSDASDSLELLSDRELQIIKRIARGMKLREIGDELNLSISTVATYKKRLMYKLNANGDIELMSFARKHGLADGKD